MMDAGRVRDILAILPRARRGWCGVLEFSRRYCDHKTITENVFVTEAYKIMFYLWFRKLSESHRLKRPIKLIYAVKYQWYVTNK
jgi:hypothetical protein